MSEIVERYINERVEERVEERVKECVEERVKECVEERVKGEGKNTYHPAVTKIIKHYAGRDFKKGSLFSL